jgi:hypothetical protein
MLKKWRFERWVRRLRASRQILAPAQPLNLFDIADKGCRYLISFPDHERNISVARHYLVPIFQKSQHHYSLLLPEKYAHLFSGSDNFESHFFYRDMGKPNLFPVQEEHISHIASVYDIGVDLNLEPHIHSHYIIASRSTKMAAGFENQYSHFLLSHTIRIGGQADYEKGLIALLKLSGLMV